MKINLKLHLCNKNNEFHAKYIKEVDTWDSLVHMELVDNLETGLGLEFKSDEIVEMTSVGAIIKLIETKQG